MDIEIAAVITVESKLELLDKLLERRIMRAALDTVTPALPLLDKVYRLGEYRRLAANLSVMAHRIRCALGDEATDMIMSAALNRFGMGYTNREVRAALKKARKVLGGLGVNPTDLNGYKKLPLYNSECRRLKRLQNKDNGCVIPVCCAEGYALNPDGRTAQAL